MTKYLSKLQSVCKSCSAETVKVYLRNTRRLYKLTNDGDEIPLNTKWINSSTLVKKYKSEPLKVRRHLSIAAVKFFQAVKKEPGNWYKYMVDDNKEYQEKRGKMKKQRLKRRCGRRKVIKQFEPLRLNTGEEINTKLPLERRRCENCTTTKRLLYSGCSQRSQ